MRERRRTFPPDFMHGDVAVADIYEVLGAKWVERAVFAVDDGGVTTIAYFDDYFLVVEQWKEGDEEDWRQWWDQRRKCRDRIVTFDIEDGRRLQDDATVQIDIDRKRLCELERGLLGMVRDSMSGGKSATERLCRGEIDVLSLVTMTNHLLKD